MIIGKCRKGGREGQKLVTVPISCNIQPGEFLVMKKVDLSDFDNIFGEVKKNGRKKR